MPGIESNSPGNCHIFKKTKQNNNLKKNYLTRVDQANKNLIKNFVKIQLEIVPTY